MAFRFLVHYMNQTDSKVYEGVASYSYANGVLTLTPEAGGTGSNFGSSAVTVNTYEGVTRIEIFPSVTQFPGNSANTPSG